MSRAIEPYPNAIRALAIAFLVAITVGVAPSLVTVANAVPGNATISADLTNPPRAAVGVSDPLFEGVLQRVDGSPMPGTTVVMFVGPENKQRNTMSVGDSFNSRPAGRTKTRSDGTFQLPMPDSTSVPSAPGIYGLTILALDDGALQSVTTTSVRVVAGRAELNTIDAQYAGQEQATVGHETSTTSSAPKAGSRIESRSGKAPFVTMTASPAKERESKTPQRAATSDEICTVNGLKTTLLQTYTNRATAVGSIHATTSGHETRFALTNGSEAMLGVAFKAEGGNWSAGGVSAVTLESTTQWAKRTGVVNTLLQTRYGAARYEVVYGEFGVCSTYYSVQPTSHEGGAESASVAAPSATYCREYEAGSGLILERGTATNWTNGFSLASIVGLDVQSSAGYSDSEKIIVDIISSTGRKICGTDRYPGENPSRVVVKPL